MGILDWLLGRRAPQQLTPPKLAVPPQKRAVPPSVSAPVAAPNGLVVTIKRPGGVVETKVVEPDGSTFEDWVADMEKKRVPESHAPRMRKAVIDEATLSVADLREVDSIRARIKGVGHWITDKERDTFGGTHYLLVREPTNEHDANAIAIYGRGRKVGYVSSAKASALASILDSLPFDAFRVAGASTIEHSTRLWADIPRIPALRAFAKGHVR